MLVGPTYFIPYNDKTQQVSVARRMTSRQHLHKLKYLPNIYSLAVCPLEVPPTSELLANA